jgi:hypothetical protein
MVHGSRNALWLFNVCNMLVSCVCVDSKWRKCCSQMHVEMVAGVLF